MESENLKLERKFKELGFVFPQPEFCIKGEWQVIVDCYPHLVETGRNKGYWFDTWDEFMEIYNAHYPK